MRHPVRSAKDLSRRERRRTRAARDTPGSARQGGARLLLVGLLLLACLGAGLAIVFRSRFMDETARAADPPAVDPPHAEIQASPPAAERTKAPRRNALANETSPYLLMHADNPVDWHPWGPAALEKAKKERKLIFLSIGYSSCYWCHVMERESFRNQQIADFLNRHFVCVKVDREERPDLDEIYMTSLEIYHQLVGSPQSGGWPLTMFLTPSGQPILGGTYFPPQDVEGRSGLPTVLKLVHDAWQAEAPKLETVAQQITSYVQQALRQRPNVLRTPLDSTWLEDVQAALAESYDSQFGGFGFSESNPRRPKFPEAAKLLFLAQRATQSNDEQARSMLIGTLDQLAAGGIRDHLGGGMHRYSTDRYWRIPHFEKMLYDQGQLASAYAAGYELTGSPTYRSALEELVDFVQREMTSPDGGFYSAIDAETDGDEGAYYVWRQEEIESALNKADYAFVAERFGLENEPNFEGRYVLLLNVDSVRQAADAVPATEAVPDRWPVIRAQLLELRQNRPRPLTDTKILSGWNGLMIAGLANAGRVLQDDRCTRMASDAAEFVLAKMRTEDGQLLHTFGEGKAKIDGFLDDYAFVADGLLALHHATGERRWLDEAQKLTDKQIELFWDAEDGGFYFTSTNHEELLARSKSPADSATPAGNAVALNNLAHLALAFDSDDYRQKAREVIKAFQGLMSRSPGSFPTMAVGLAALETSAPQAAPSAP